MTCEILPIRAEDTCEVRSLLAHVARESRYMLYLPEEVSLDQKSIESMQDRFHTRASFGFVAQCDGHFVGFVLANRLNVFKAKHVVSLVIGVLQNYQGRGVASNLLEHIFHKALQENILRIELTVIKDNVAAKKLYEKLGFVEEGIRHSSIRSSDGSLIDEIYLAKLL